MIRGRKWKRIRPGLYQLIDPSGLVLAEIERGAESRRWWWVVYDGGARECGYEVSLKHAKAQVEEEI